MASERRSNRPAIAVTSDASNAPDRPTVAPRARTAKSEAASLTTDREVKDLRWKALIASAPLIPLGQRGRTFFRWPSNVEQKQVIPKDRGTLGQADEPTPWFGSVSHAKYSLSECNCDAVSNERESGRAHRRRRHVDARCIGGPVRIRGA